MCNTAYTVVRHVDRLHMPFGAASKGPFTPAIDLALILLLPLSQAAQCAGCPVSIEDVHVTFAGMQLQLVWYLPKKVSCPWGPTYRQALPISSHTTGQLRINRCCNRRLWHVFCICGNGASTMICGLCIAAGGGVPAQEGRSPAGPQGQAPATSSCPTDGHLRSARDGQSHRHSVLSHACCVDTCQGADDTGPCMKEICLLHAFSSTR